METAMTILTSTLGATPAAVVAVVMPVHLICNDQKLDNLCQCIWGWFD